MSSAHPATVQAYASTDDRSTLPAVVREMASGRQEAMGRLYDATGPLVYGWLLRVLEHQEDAEALTLEVYLRAWRNAAFYSTGCGSVQAWLLAMARSVAAGRTRAHAAGEEGE